MAALSAIPSLQSSAATVFGACSQTLRTGQRFPTSIPIFTGTARHGLEEVRLSVSLITR